MRVVHKVVYDIYYWVVAREVIGWSAKPNSRGQYPDDPPIICSSNSKNFRATGENNEKKEKI